MIVSASVQALKSVLQPGFCQLVCFCKYRIFYIGSDDTYEAELVFFDKAGKELLDKPVLTLLRCEVPHAMSLEEAIQFGSRVNQLQENLLPSC